MSDYIPPSPSQPEIWHETLHHSVGQYFTLDNVLYRQKTAHQDLIIFDTPLFGRVMALDGVIQTTERDEFIYHEMMTHVPLFAHSAPQKVLIIGGGDGGMLREVCQHQALHHITMVEIDAEVITLCRQYLPNHHRGAYDDPRVRLVIDDGMQFVNHTAEKFDVIISDCPDPIGPGESLFTSQFYQGCARCLNDGGIFVAQNGVSFLQPDELINSYTRLKHAFSDVSFYQAAIPTYYGGMMTFAWASNHPALRQQDLATLQQRVHTVNPTCRYYNPTLHLASFALPQYLLDTLSNVGY